MRYLIHPALKNLGVSGGAFPNDEDLPPTTLKLLDRLLVPANVVVELPLPEIYAALRQIGVLAARMTVPIAAMHQYDRTIFREHDVRVARKIADMDAKAKTHPVQHTADD